jgi:rhodanese-related sulfurtransferase
MMQQGFKEVYNLEGGIDAWSKDIDSSIPKY